MNSFGYIMASTDKGRLGLQHQGAVVALRNRKELVVSKEMVKNLPNTQEGITVPLCLEKDYIGALGITGNPDQLTGSASLLRLAVLSLVRITQLEQLSSSRHKVLDAWIDNLASDQFEDYELFGEQARYLGIDLSQICSLIFIDIEHLQQKQIAGVENLIVETVEKISNLQFISYVGKNRFLLSVEAGTLDDRALLYDLGEALDLRLTKNGHIFHIGIGRPGKGLIDYRRSYLDAYHSVRIAKRLSSAKHLLCYHEHYFFRLLESMPDYIRETFIHDQLEDRQLDSVQLDTLKTYFAMNRHLNETAAALYIHRNTLLFRLKKISEILGLDPQNFHDSVTLQVLLYLMELSQAESDRSPHL
jgi:carbohydrate diacid regulator